MVIPVVWYSTHPSVIIVIQSLDNLGTLAAVRILLQVVAESVSTVRRWELSLQAQNISDISKPFKTTNGPNGLCT